MKKRYLAIIGPTASGKSDLAMEIARRYQGELINCDSVQVYRGFDIGAAKPSLAERQKIPHHLIDCFEWNENFDARVFAHRAEALINEIESRGKLPIVVGGTGLYLRALWQDAFHDLPKDMALREELAVLSAADLRVELERLDPRRSAEIHDNDRFRLQRAVEVARLLGHSVKDLGAPESKRDEAFVISIDIPRTGLQERIALRSKKMLDAGLIEEVEGLLQRGVPADCKPMQSIGYREVVEYLQGDLDRSQLEEAIVIATRQYAKRQMTLFRKVPKDLEWNPERSLDGLDRLWS